MFRGKTIIESFTHIDDGSPRSFLFIIIMFFYSFDPVLRVQGNRSSVW